MSFYEEFMYSSLQLFQKRTVIALRDIYISVYGSRYVITDRIRKKHFKQFNINIPCFQIKFIDQSYYLNYIEDVITKTFMYKPTKLTFNSS